MKDKKAAEPTGMNDAALVERAKNGDQAAYTALYESTAQETFRSIRSMVRTEEQALDIQQDAYVYAFTHLDTLGEPKKFRAWLRAIAVNRTRSVLRKQTPVLFSELESEEGEGLPELADTDPAASPELALERKETAAYLKEILGELTVGQRMLVGLYYYEQQSVGQIAEALEVTPGTVKTQLFRARKRIESAVKALEQRGVKLWGLSPLPFLLSLMKRSEPAAEASRTVLQGALTQAGLGAETVAVHVGRGFFQTVLGRAVLGVAAAAALGGGVLGYGWVREHYALGDVQPPTETVLLLQTTEETRDTDEDLTPIPTQLQDTEAPDTPEDLTEPTEPDTTEPTEPSTQSPEPSNPANPEPTQPDDPKPTNPDNPDATQPGGTTPSSSGEPIPAAPSGTPTESEQSSETPEIEPKFLRWYWVNHENLTSMDMTDQLSPSMRLYICVEVQGELAPSVTMDNAGVIELVYSGKSDSNDEIQRYYWYVSYVGSGSTRLSCSFQGTVRGTLTFTNSDHSAEFLFSTWSFWGGVQGDGIDNQIGEKIIGNSDELWVYEQHNINETPSIRVYTDSPGVLSVVYVGSGPGTHWYEYHMRWRIKVIGCGTAKLYVEYNGEIVKTYTITVPETPNEILPSQ